MEKQLTSYYASLENELSGDKLFRMPYPVRQQRVTETATGENVAPTSCVDVPEFCWTRNSTELRTERDTHVMALYTAAGLKKQNLQKRKCLLCDTSYPRGNILPNTDARVTTLWGKGEGRRKTDPTCIDCMAGKRMIAWLKATGQDVDDVVSQVGDEGNGEGAKDAKTVAASDTANDAST